MAKGKDSKRKKPTEVMPIPIHCAGSKCEEETALLLPGKIPYRQAIWLEDGWTALNELSNRSLYFVCAGCRAKGEAGLQITENPARLAVKS